MCVFMMAHKILCLWKILFMEKLSGFNEINGKYIAEYEMQTIRNAVMDTDTGVMLMWKRNEKDR